MSDRASKITRALWIPAAESQLSAKQVAAIRVHLAIIDEASEKLFAVIHGSSLVVKGRKPVDYTSFFVRFGEPDGAPVSANSVDVSAYIKKGVTAEKAIELLAAQLEADKAKKAAAEASADAAAAAPAASPEAAK